MFQRKLIQPLPFTNAAITENMEAPTGLWVTPKPNMYRLVQYHTYTIIFKESNKYIM